METTLLDTALTTAVIWEWHAEDPVVEIKLLKERNFALANFLYFLFSFRRLCL